MTINFSPHFKRSYQKLPIHIQTDFNKQIALFIQNPKHPSLKTHTLKGKFQECLAFQLRDGYRVLFEYIAPNVVNLLDTGSHDVYKKR
ncbi:MAG: cytotoxin [Candidatus Magasanikbacteria bacterium CG11_big_fil_rev_8_21_14_0_20_43_7]|uniref:Cytotoxin n=1 Tax=Candidatus Magasanikbacteria bacterium CG11_big_fil_rev_8_21_14_0_20_43_7 TaxID=1974654 RepID=A0A2H0N1X2_9BACT|nr:MAG: cytotoxin [Candidatus Magasanikbacteria bacterium CG11_big_fil_rev_8_21_14_0_20_43_7]